MAGVASWIVLSRLLPRSPGPTRYYVTGLGALLLCAWQLSRLSETANPLHSVMPALHKAKLWESFLAMYGELEKEAEDHRPGIATRQPDHSDDRGCRRNLAIPLRGL